MGASEKRHRGCVHLGVLTSRKEQLQHSLLHHCSARQAAGLPPLPLGQGWLCLGCSAVCTSPAEHAGAGLRQRPACSGREPLLDLRTAELYCPICADYVFDRGFDLTLQTAMAAPKSGAASDGAVTGHDEPGGRSDAGAPRSCVDAGGGGGAALDDVAEAADVARMLVEGFSPVSPDGFPAGLRGLNNLGNTCFMNSVLQALLHAPLLRNHYLLNRHSRAGCSVTADGGFCVNCELDGVFSAAYSGRRAGYSPAQFLYTWWMLAGGHMAGYQQQDAHEFFCFILEMMGATEPGTGGVSHAVFGGTLRSDVICSACGHVSTSHEQFSHISLDIPPPQQLIAPTILARPTGGSQATAAAATATGTTAKASGSKAGGTGASKKAGSGSVRPAPAANGASKGSKLVGAAKASRERALARKAAEDAAGTVAGPGVGGGSEASAAFPPGHMHGAAAEAGLAARQAAAVKLERGQLEDSSGPELMDTFTPSESMSLGASFGGFGGTLGHGGLEAASGVHTAGDALTVDDDAMDTLSSPRQQLMGVFPEVLQRAASGVMGAVASIWPAPSSQQPPAAQQPAQQAQQSSGRHAQASGRPPMPPGPRSARGAGAAPAGGPRRSAGSGKQAQRAQQAQQDSGSPEADHSPPNGSGLSAAAAAFDAGLASSAMQDSLAAATNLPGSQDAAAAGPTLPPQLAGYYRWPGASLLGCLHRFTRPEQLGSGERWVCDRCASGRHAVKQLSLRRLPPLLVFHTKRFEHAGGFRAVAKKLDTFLSFPMRDLDMRPYLSSAVLRSRYRLAPPQPSPTTRQPQRQQEQQQQQKQHGGGPPGLEPAAEEATQGTAAAAETDPGAYLYDLYAVVCHKGSFQGGHYVAYVKAADQRWYLCDDAWVTAADEEAVRNCQAYMLFYTQRRLLEAREAAPAGTATATAARKQTPPRRK